MTFVACRCTGFLQRKEKIVESKPEIALVIFCVLFQIVFCRTDPGSVSFVFLMERNGSDKVRHPSTWVSCRYLGKCVW